MESKGERGGGDRCNGTCIALLVLIKSCVVRCCEWIPLLNRSELTQQSLHPYEFSPSTNSIPTGFRAISFSVFRYSSVSTHLAAHLSGRAPQAAPRPTDAVADENEDDDGPVPGDAPDASPDAATADEAEEIQLTELEARLRDRGGDAPIPFFLDVWSWGVGF